MNKCKNVKTHAMKGIVNVTINGYFGFIIINICEFIECVNLYKGLSLHNRIPWELIIYNNGPNIPMYGVDGIYYGLACIQNKNNVLLGLLILKGLKENYLLEYKITATIQIQIWKE
jgi:hypothetical protein